MKTVAVTGGRRGPGRVTAGKLAGVAPRPADLASLTSIRTLAAALAGDAGRIDVVFSIAGVLQASPSRRVTAG
jgi:NAD(P)-dependent dehydrogenase (short-subunit alcohol dehydrogenase family)